MSPINKGLIVFYYLNFEDFSLSMLTYARWSEVQNNGDIVSVIAELEQHCEIYCETENIWIRCSKMHQDSVR